MPEETVDNPELAPPEKIEKPDDPEKEPPVVPGEVEDGECERDKGEGREIARHGFADPPQKRPLGRRALDAVAFLHALPHVPAERKLDEKREKQQHGER